MAGTCGKHMRTSLSSEGDNQASKAFQPRGRPELWRREQACKIPGVHPIPASYAEVAHLQGSCSDYSVLGEESRGAAASSLRIKSRLKVWGVVF